MDYYRQVELTSDNFKTVAWIDEVGAKVGKVMKLKDSDDPEREWRVSWASETRIPKTEALERAREAREFKDRGSIAHQ